MEHIRSTASRRDLVCGHCNRSSDLADARALRFAHRLARIYAFDKLIPGKYALLPVPDALDRARRALPEEPNLC